jgi:anti-sigma factor RsiW
MMQCRRAQGLIDMYAGEEIPTAHRAALEAHLAACSACREHQARLEKLLALLRRIPPLPPVPEGFNDRLLARARQRREMPPRVPAVRPRLRDWWDFLRAPQTAGAVGAIAAGLLLGVLMGQQASREWSTATVAAPEALPVDLLGGHGLDLLSGSPRGSFTDAYLSLTSQPDGRET